MVHFFFEVVFLNRLVNIPTDIQSAKALIYRNAENAKHKVSPKIQRWVKNCIAYNGKWIEQYNKSASAKLIMNIVVVQCIWRLNLVKKKNENQSRSKYLEKIIYCLFSTFIIKKVNDGTRKTMNVIFQWNFGLFERLNGLYKLYFVHEWNEWTKYNE